MAPRSQASNRRRFGVDSSGWDGTPYNRPTPVTHLGITVTYNGFVVTFDHT